MTARFGRNKRRAARAAIAALELEVSSCKHALALERELVAVQQQKRRDAEGLLGDIAERLRRALGGKTGLLPLELLPKQRWAREKWARKEPIQRDLDGYFAMSAAPEPLSLDVSYDVDTLLRLVTSVVSDPYQYRRIIRFVDPDDVPHPKFSGRAMWVSESMLQTVGIMGSDLHHLANDIARQLVELPARGAR